MRDLPTLTGNERTILELLVARGEMDGLQLAEACSEIKRGTVEKTLGRMLAKGVVEISQTVESNHEGGLPRKLYRVSGLGSGVLAARKPAQAAQAEAALRALLLRLPKDGKKFEHLVRLALEELLDRRVWQARSGAQAGADMGSGNHHWPVVRLEAKRYKGKLQEKGLLGELSEAIREEPALDLWILATTTEVSEKLARALTESGERLGLGVEILDLSDSRHCKLPLLLAAAMEPACELIREVLGASREQELRTILSAVKSREASDYSRDLLEAKNLFDLVAEKARADLSSLLTGPQNSMKRLSQTVHDQHRFVERKEIFAALEEWYSKPKERERLVAVCGEEGVGKTWAVYPWLYQKAHAEELLPIVFPASQTTTLQSLEAGIAANIHSLFPNTTEDSWKRRVGRWLDDDRTQGRMLILFDGLNEQPNTNWRGLLDQVFKDSKQPVNLFERAVTARAAIPTLVTCRSGYWNQSLADIERWNTRLVEVSPFNDAEVRDYLRLHGRRLEEFSHEIRGLLKIPRFCDLAAKHHDRLLASGDISKDRLLYEDWKDRYRRKSSLPMDDRRFQVLMSGLAEEFLARGKRFREHEIVRFLPEGKREEILVELKTGGVFVEASDGRLKVQPDRLYHALGLLLLQQLREASGATAEEQREVIASCFEPAGIDAHASICSAAIFGTTVDREVPLSTIVLLFRTFFSLQNLSDGDWENVRGYFPVIPEVYRQLGEELVSQPESPRKAWKVVEWAYLKWCDEPTLFTTIQEHCHRWFSLLPVRSPWASENESAQEEYVERVNRALGQAPEAGSITVRAEAFTFVDSQSLHLLYHLAISCLSGRPCSIRARVLRTFGLSTSLQNYRHCDEAAWWLVKFLGSNTTLELIAEIEGLLAVEDPVWQEAAFRLAGMLPGQPAKQLRARSSYEEKRLFDEWHSEDPCSTGFYFWLDEDCEACLTRPDVGIEAKVTNISSRSNDPSFTLPNEIAEALVDGLTALLGTLDGDDRMRSQQTSTDLDLDRWEMAFARWVPKELRSFSVAFLSRFDISRLEEEPEDKEKRASSRFRMELGARRLRDVALLLDHNAYNRLYQFWQAWGRRTAEERKNYSVIGDLDLLEADLFGILLLLGDEAERPRLLLERSTDTFNDSRLMDVVPLGLSEEALRQLWKQLLELPDSALLSKVSLLALDSPALNQEQREQLVLLATRLQNRGDILIPLTALLSEDVDLVSLLLEAGVPTALELVSELYWIPAAAIPPEVSLEQLGRISAPILSHLVTGRDNDGDLEVLARAVRRFVETGDSEWRPNSWAPRRSPRSWCSFSRGALGRTFRADSSTLEFLLDKASAGKGSSSPIEHSYWLYFAVCEYLMEEEPEKAEPLLGSLIETRYVGKNNGPEPHGLISLMARWSCRPSVARQLENCLDLCVTDSSLQSFALSFEVGSIWLWDTIERDLNAGRPLIVARALTLAGFSHDSDRAIAVLEAQSSKTAWWVESVRTNSLALARKASWSRYWFEEFLTRKDEADSWAAFRLFLRCVDRRYYSWLNEALEKEGFQYRDSSRKMKHLRVNSDKVIEKIEDFEKKQLAERFCHSKFAKDSFPWSEQWRLSAETLQQIVRGEPSED